MKGIRTNNRTGEEREVELRFEIIEGKHGKIFQLRGGPTGFENFYIEDGDVERMSEHGWCACAGGSRWDKLTISGDEMKKAFDELQLSKQEEVS